MGMFFYAHVLICGKSLFSHRVRKGFGTCDCQCVNDIHFRFVDKAEGSLPPSLRDFGIFTREFGDAERETVISHNAGPLFTESLCLVLQ